MRLKEEEGEGKESSTSLCSLLEEICLGRMREKERTESESLLPSLDGVEDILRYKFNNRSLLEEAFIHPSYHYPEKPCVSYERLEYVGDSVLNLLMAKELFLLYPDLSPGPLTKLRAANVDNEKLARVAIKHGFHRYIRHKSPSLEEQIREFNEAILAYPVHSNGLIDTPKFLADIVESAIGAVYLDSNFSLDSVWKVFKGLLEPMISPQTLGMHPMTELMELCQKKGMRVRFVDAWQQNTTIDVLVDGILVGSANYSLKKEIAQNRAAKAALDNLKRTLLN